MEIQDIVQTLLTMVAKNGRSVNSFMEKYNSFYSNCFFEAIKAKIKNPKFVKITVVLKSEARCPHFLWSDGKNDYDFGVNKPLKWWQIIWFKGSIRKRNLGFNKRYKEMMLMEREENGRNSVD